jgi:excisionase family DNA binding protein
MMDKLWTAEELAEYLNVSKAAIYAMVYRKEIPFLKIGRRVRFRCESVEEWIAEGCPDSQDHSRN